MYKIFSRTRNKISIVVIGSKEFLAQSHANLNRRVELQCDDRIIQLPALQGIVIMNIPSYMAGINFWGAGSNESDQVLLNFMHLQDHFRAKEKLFKICHFRAPVGLKVTFLKNSSFSNADKITKLIFFENLLKNEL